MHLAAVHNESLTYANTVVIKLIERHKGIICPCACSFINVFMFYILCVERKQDRWYNVAVLWKEWHE